MPPASTLLHRLLRGLVLRLVVMLGGVLAGRERRMRARVAAMPEGHRHRARLLRELARMAWIRAVLADPGFLDDPRTAGKAAEVARCMGDAGRRAAVRRPVWIARRRRRVGAGRVVAACAVEERCSSGRAALN